MKWFSNLGGKGLFAALFALSLVLVQCGGSDSGDDGDTPAATAEDDDTAAAAGASSAVGGLVTGTSGGAVASESVALHIKAMAINGIKAEAIDFDETIAIPCTDGGSISSDVSGTVDIGDSSVTLDFTSTATFDACAESGSVALEDGSTCDFSFVMDGEFTCTMAGSASSETDFEMTMDCSTASACDGVTISINGEDHTMGMSMTGSMSGTDTEPTLTGDICIDGESFDMDDLEDATVADDALTCS